MFVGPFEDTHLLKKDFNFSISNDQTFIQIEMISTLVTGLNERDVARANKCLLVEGVLINDRWSKWN